MLTAFHQGMDRYKHRIDTFSWRVDVLLPMSTDNALDDGGDNDETENSLFLLT